MFRQSRFPSFDNPNSYLLKSVDYESLHHVTLSYPCYSHIVCARVLRMLFPSAFNPFPFRVRYYISHPVLTIVEVTRVIYL